MKNLTKAVMLVTLLAGAAAAADTFATWEKSYSRSKPARGAAYGQAGVGVCYGTTIFAGDNLPTLKAVEPYVLQQMEGQTVYYAAGVRPSMHVGADKLSVVYDKKLLQLATSIKGDGGNLKLTTRAGDIPAGNNHGVFNGGTDSGGIDWLYEGTILGKAVKINAKFSTALFIIDSEEGQTLLRISDGKIQLSGAKSRINIIAAAYVLLGNLNL